MKLLRLFISEKDLNIGKVIEIFDNDFDYLIKVMRKKNDDQILVFNGYDGEFKAQICSILKKTCQIIIKEKVKDWEKSSNITLAFAPVKNIRIDFIATKATEMGVNKFQPIITAHSVVDDVNSKRFLANIKEAAEQCERLDIPSFNNIVKLNHYLDNLLKNIAQNQQNQPILILCDESGLANKASEVLKNIKILEDQEIIIFVGPEGGFSKEEFSKFYNLKNPHNQNNLVYNISLGKRILRSDTAIISALALVGEFCS